MKGEVRGRLASQLAGVTMTLTQLLGAVMTGVSSPVVCKAAVGGRTGEEGAGGESLRRLWDGADGGGKCRRAPARSPDGTTCESFRGSFLLWVGCRGKGLRLHLLVSSCVNALSPALVTPLSLGGITF